MTDTFSPPVWRRRVSTEMRRLRRAAGLQQADAAEALSCKVPKISLIENGQRNLHDDDQRKLLDLYGVPAVDHDYYLTAAERARQKGWWESYGEPVVPNWLQRYLGLEQGADRLRTYEPAIFHGLLQTPEYSRAVFTTMTLGFSNEVLRRIVAVRQRRQEAITRDLEPLGMTAVIDESALHRVLGGPEVMRGQLEHAADLAERLPHVTVRILPFDRGVIGDGFSIFSFDWPDDPGVVYLEYADGAVYLDDLTDVDSHARIFDRLQALSLPAGESVEMLRAAATRFGRT